MANCKTLVPIENIPALGQNISIGSLYNIRTNEIMKCSKSNGNLEANHITSSMKSTHFRVSVSDTFKQRSSLMDISTNILLSLLSPPISLTGSAKYLESRNSHTKSTSVTLRLSKLDCLKILNDTDMANYNSMKKETPEVTHIISQITYGSDSYFVFEQNIEDDQSKEDVRDSLSVIIECAIERVSGRYSTGRKPKITDKNNDIRCKFYGDFQVARSPTTFEEAIQLINMIVSGAVKRNSRPISFNAQPIPQSFDAPCTMPVYSVSDIIILRICRLRNYQERCLMELDDLIGSAIFCNDSFEKVRKFIEEVKRMFCDNNLKFNDRICHLLKQIKCGHAHEDEMIYLITVFEQSRFGKEKYAIWYEDMKLEIQFVEQILMKIRSNDNESRRNIIQVSKGKNPNASLVSEDRRSNYGRYKLSINLQSFMDIRLLDHLEAEYMVTGEGRNLDNYPMSPSFLNDDSNDTKFITQLSQKIDAFKTLANFDKNKENSNLMFSAVINYPSEAGNTASVGVMFDGIMYEGIDVDFQLKIHQLSSKDEGISEFRCQLYPKNAKFSSQVPNQIDYQTFPDSDIELCFENFDKTISSNKIEHGSISHGHDHTDISLCVPSSTTPFIVRASMKIIGGAQYPQVVQNIFYSIHFNNFQYDLDRHQLKVDLAIDRSNLEETDKHSINKNHLFDVEFRYRNVEDEERSRTKVVKSDLVSKHLFSVQLEEEDKGYFECQCRYVVKNEHNCMLGPDSQYIFLIEGGKEGSWSPIQYLVFKS